MKNQHSGSARKGCQRRERLGRPDQRTRRLKSRRGDRAKPLIEKTGAEDAKEGLLVRGGGDRGLVEKASRGRERRSTGDSRDEKISPSAEDVRSGLNRASIVHKAGGDNKRDEGGNGKGERVTKAGKGNIR